MKLLMGQSAKDEYLIIETREFAYRIYKRNNRIEFIKR